MKSYTSITFLLVIVAVVLLQTINVAVQAVFIDDCAAGKPSDAKLVWVEIENCGEKDPYCPFIKGRNASIQVKFATTASFDVAKVNIVGSKGAFKYHFKVDPEDACGHYGFDCPVGPNEDKTLKLSLPVKRIYPTNLSAKARFLLEDRYKKPIFCISFPIKVVEE